MAAENAEAIGDTEAAEDTNAIGDTEIIGSNKGSGKEKVKITVGLLSAGTGMEMSAESCEKSYVFNRKDRMKVRIPVYDPQQDQQLMQYDRTYSQAMSHLAAGNWEQTIVLLRPLMSQYPTEKKLYLAVLRAATQDFGDIDMDNTANRTIASEAWNKLVRLNGVTSEMIEYGSRRYEAADLLTLMLLTSSQVQCQFFSPRSMTEHS